MSVMDTVDERNPYGRCLQSDVGASVESQSDQGSCPTAARYGDKLAQCRDGATFVGAVVDAVGMADRTLVWSSPETCLLVTRLHRSDSSISG